MNAPARLDLRADPPAEQGLYADWLDATSRLGLAVLALAYVAYLFDFLPPHVPLERLPELWGLPASAFMAHTGSPAGWGWVAFLHRGDILNLLGIAILAGGSLICLLAVIPIYHRRGETIYVALCGLQIVVLALAASGLLGGGH